MISQAYREQLQELHESKPDFGTSSAIYAPLIRQLIAKYQPDEITDYGAGKQVLKTVLGIREGYQAYDPSIPAISAVPHPTDLVVCTDVLEHVEREHLNAVLDDLQRVTKKAIFLAVHTGKALNVLPDGRNAHITQEQPRWWIPKILDRFDIIYLDVEPLGFITICHSRPIPI